MIIPDKNTKSWMAFACAAVGAALVILYVASFGVNVPVNDDWDQVHTSVHWRAEGMDTKSLFALHNEHCLALPRLWTHAILLTTHGNFKAVLISNAFLLAALVVLPLWFIGQQPLPLPLMAVVCVAIGLAVSSWCQWQNMLWAFQSPFFLLPLILLSAAILILRTRSAAMASLTGACALWLAVFTNGNGIIVGWALLPSILAGQRASAGNSSRNWRFFYFVNLAFATGTAFWLIASSGRSGLGDMPGPSSRPGEVLFILLAILGSPFAPVEVFAGQNGAAAIAGALTVLFAVGLCVAFSFAATPKSWRNTGPGAALALYGLLSVAAVVYGRYDLILTSPIESRYQGLALSWIVGLIISGATLATTLAGRSKIAILSATSLLAITTSVATIRAMPFFYGHGENMRSALETHQEILQNSGIPGRWHELELLTQQRFPGNASKANELRSLLSEMEQFELLHPDLKPFPK